MYQSNWSSLDPVAEKEIRRTITYKIFITRIHKEMHAPKNIYLDQNGDVHIYEEIQQVDVEQDNRTSPSTH